MKDQTWFITGSTGIGGETARLAAAGGARVFVVSRTEANWRELVAALRDAGAEADGATVDVTRAAEVDAAVSRCVSTFGRIDAAFNVAGISGRRFGDGPAHECTDDGWAITLDTNARGIFYCCRAILRQMLDQPVGADGLRGAILNMASVLGFSPEPKHFGTHAYAASKGAIIAMTRAMAATYAPQRIRVNVIAPGLVRTPMARRATENPAIQQAMKHKQPLFGEMLDAVDVARAALFLLGNESRAITGDTLIVDGGWCVSG